MPDESFFTDAQMQAICRERWGAERLPSLRDVMNGVWPERLPLDFDHLLLDEWGLSRKRHTLVQEIGGWRVWSIEALVNHIAPLPSETQGVPSFRDRWKDFAR